MRILFVENRYATWVWSVVAERLQLEGHEVHWIVQNPVFRPRLGMAHQLPFPDSRAQSNASSMDDRPVMKYPDRSVTYFGRTSAHHRPYCDSIKKVIHDVRPDVMFGEQTQIHELFAIEEARRLRIPYLCPSATRYPADRLTFCVNDTMEAICGSRDKLSDAAALAMLCAIRERRLVPSYMRAPQHRTWRRKVRYALDKTRVTWGWLRGERYLTPSPWRKFRLGRSHAGAVALWESFALERLSDEQKSQQWVLYPLQMQPEANIEVWGYPWHDQVDIVRRAADSVGARGATLLVKPNPKSKYEMSRALCELCAAHPAIRPMSHAVRMQELLPHAAAVLSVTGTVILESAFARKPVAVLGEHGLSRVPGVRRVVTPEEVADVLSEALEHRYRYATEPELVAYLQQLYAESYAGTPFDPVHQPELGTEENLRAMHESFRAILRELPHTWGSRVALAGELT